MTDETINDNPEPGVLTQAYPQLEASPTDAVAQDRPGNKNELQPVPMQTMELVKNPPRDLTPIGVPNLGLLSDIPVTVVFEVGNQKISLPQLMELARGSIVPLPNIYVDSIDVKVSGTTIAKAETINLKQRYGVRLSELVIPPGMGLD